METITFASIRTPFGEVELIPQDLNLLQVSSIEPLQFSGDIFHLWGLIERIRGTWRVSEIAGPLVHRINRESRTTSIAGEAETADLMSVIITVAGDWAASHPAALESAAARAFEFDREGLCRELEALRESLSCSAQAIDSITSGSTSRDGARLREFSQRMRRMALEMPAMQKFATDVRYRSASPNLRNELPHPGSLDAPAATARAPHLRDVTSSQKSRTKAAILGQSNALGLSTSQPTLGAVVQQQRTAIGLSRQEFALKLGIKPAHVTQLESDSGPRPSFQLLGRVADILGLDKDQMIQLAESGARVSSSARRSVPRKGNDQRRVWGTFSRNRALLDRYDIKPRELKALSQVNLMGKVSRSETLLFILEAIRESGDTEE